MPKSLCNKVLLLLFFLLLLLLQYNVPPTEIFEDLMFGSKYRLRYISGVPNQQFFFSPSHTTKTQTYYYLDAELWPHRPDFQTK